jgi:NDP-sugar pyrophosphorylase family protein
VNVPALVLTAGLGTRLDPLTRLVAKPAVPLGDRSLIEHVLGWLHREGVRDVVLNLHHRPASITGIVGDGAHLGLSVRYSWEHPILGSAGGPRRALPLLASATFLIVNGDTLCDFPLAPVLDAHFRSGADVTLAAVPHPRPHHYNGIAAGEDGRVTGFVPKGPEAEGTWHLVGVQVVNSTVFASLPDGEPAETVAGIYRTMVAETPGRVRVCPVSTSFVDVGTPADYLHAALAQSGTAMTGDVHSSADVRTSVVWSGARVEADAELSDVIVAGPVTIPRGSRLQSSVVVPAAVWRAGDHGALQGDIAIFPIDRSRD